MSSSTDHSSASPATAPIPGRAGRTLRFLLLPAALVFLVTGFDKVLHPVGVAPPIVRAAIAPAAWTQLLRGLGGMEILLALGLLIFPRAWPVRAATLALIITFFATIAFGSADRRFMGQCGCLPSLDTDLAAEERGIFVHLGVLGALIALSAAAECAARGCLKKTAAFAIGGTTLFALAGTFWGVHAHRAAYARMIEAENGDDRWVLPFEAKRTFPRFRILAANGDPIGLRDLMGPSGAHIIFFSPDCPHCRDAAPRWRDRAAADRAAGREFVLISTVADRGAIAEFMKNLVRDPSIACHQIPNPTTVRRLGMIGLPFEVEMDPDGKVERMTGMREPSPR